MIFFFLTILSSVFLIDIEIGVLAFIATIIIISIAVIVKIIKNKKLEKQP
jgi:ABC-type protease/lipase transport system fused ATPase/permease subunit